MRPRKAFTLIEVLVVIAIIGLLVSILIPSLTGARDQARALQCASNLRSFGTGFMVYAGDNRDYLCSGQADARPGMNLDPSIENLGQTGIERIGWIADLVKGKYAMPGSMLCPSNRGQQTQSWGRALSLPDATERYTPETFMRLRDELGFNTLAPTSNPYDTLAHHSAPCLMDHENQPPFMEPICLNFN